MLTLSLSHTQGIPQALGWVFWEHSLSSDLGNHASSWTGTTSLEDERREADELAGGGSGKGNLETMCRLQAGEMSLLSKDENLSPDARVLGAASNHS